MNPGFNNSLLLNSYSNSVFFKDSQYMLLLINEALKETQLDMKVKKIIKLHKLIEDLYEKYDLFNEKNRPKRVVINRIYKFYTNLDKHKDIWSILKKELSN